MGRSLWLAAALAALWLWVSLVPQVTYPTASSGEPAGDVLIAWPGWAVQQDIGPLSGTIGRFEIWVSSDPDGDGLTLLASLVDASTKEVLRETRILTTPSYTPVARTLTFPSYDVPDGQRLLLQLEVAAWDGRHVIYGLTHAQSQYANLALNGVPDAGSGPLAFAHYVTSSGLRAATRDHTDARVKLALALSLTFVAALTHPLVRARRGLQRAATAWKRIARQATIWKRRLDSPTHEAYPGQLPLSTPRILAAPWYPWPAVLIPILHFLASNPLHFTVRDSLIPAGAVLIVVTVGVSGLRLALRAWHPAAVTATVVTAIIFAYGHADRALDGRLDDYVLLPTAAVLATATVVLAVRHQGRASHLTPFLNVTVGILLLFQIIPLIGMPFGVSVRAPDLYSAPQSDTSDQLPDIFYIILDGYGRQDTLGQFDNSKFLKELEHRGFFVARDATSNYRNTIQSLASSLNLAYLHDLEPTVRKTKSDALSLVHNNALAATLQTLGYTYVHLESGSVISNHAPTADIFVTFTPAGVVISSAKEETRHSSYIRAAQDEGIRQSSFLRSLIENTALRTLTGHRFRPGDDTPYEWWAPERTLQMFEFLSDLTHTSGPAFVFAHIIKPHAPATFDRHGNMLISHRKQDEFSDTHDSTVPDAYIGQLLYINSLTLRTVDRILKSRSKKPIIIIASDHSRDESDRHAILAAFHFPDGGNTVLYPSISSVNHFRSVLDYYFGLNLGLLEDIRFEHDANQFDIPRVPTTNSATR